MAGFSSPGSEVDANILTQAGQGAQQQNPMQTMVGLQELQGLSLQNRMLGQEVQGRIAMGQAAQQAVDPDTGVFDGDKFLKILSQNPSGSFLVPEAASQAVARQLQQTQLSQTQLDLAKSQMGMVSDVVGGILSQPPGSDGKPAPLTRDGVVKTLTSRLLDSGLFHDPQSIQQLAGVVSTLPNDDAGLRNTLAQIWFQSHATSEGIDMLKGAPVTQNTGSQQITRQVSPMTGETTVDNVVNTTRTPEEKAQLVPVWDPEKQQYVSQPSGQLIGDMAPGAVPGQQNSVAVPTQAPMGAAETAASNVQQAQALQQRAAIVPQRKAALSNLVGTLSNFTPGPKADLTGVLKGLATQFGIAPPGVAQGKAAQDEFNKLAAQIALDQWGTLGGTGSNEQLATAVHANPNEYMSKLGIKNVVALLQGNEDAIGAQFDAWKKYSAQHGPASYGDFIEGWNRYYDPRVFQAQHMAPAAVKVMLQNMAPAERKKYLQDQAIAQQAGWIQ